jgi:hypothetical protein
MILLALLPLAIAAVPEVGATISLLGLGITGLVLLQRRFR